jgi:ActR/RegA family two-component response regulator
VVDRDLQPPSPLLEGRTTPDAKILVVDDEQSILDLVTAYLRREGYEVRTAMDGPGGLKAARAYKPDLIVYTLHFLDDGEIEGMLSVHGNSGDVWYHSWHGGFVAMMEGHG